MKEFKTIVGEAIGEASMCWSETPSGTFESNQASLIVDKILEAHHAVLAEKLGLALTEIKRRKDVPMQGDEA